MTLSLSPIFPWPLVAIASLAVLGSTIWFYKARLRGADGRWKWFAIGLRMVAVLMCILAALRPSVVIPQKVKQAASVAFLVDASSSMGITDEVGNQSRRDVARQTLDRAREVVAGLGGDLDVKFYRFDGELKEFDPNETGTASEGRESAYGTAMVEALKAQNGKRLAAAIVLGDGASNAGLPPIDAAEQFKSQQVPVVAVGFGSASAGAGSRDLAVRDLTVPSTVYSKNVMPARGTIRVRGFADEPLDLELLVEGAPVANKQVKVGAGQELATVSGLSYTADSPGEKRVTLRLKPKDGELVKSNNEYSTYITVLSGGLNVLYLQGPNFSNEYRFLVRALDNSPEIHVDLKILRAPSRGDLGELDSEDLAPGKYDVFIIGDMPADRLTKRQQALMKQAVDRGAGIMFLGGRDSFGPGGWGSTAIADLLPMAVHPGDGEINPPDGLKVVPHPGGSDDYLMQLGPTRAASAEIWSKLPPINGANDISDPKRIARVLADTPQGKPLLLSMDVGPGRVIAFGGETWPWARAGVLATSEAVAAAHSRFWRQAILWLAHKEDDNQSQVKLTLDRRRVAIGQKLDLTARAVDAKGQPITDAAFEAIVAPVEKPEQSDQRVDLANQGEDSRGSYYATKTPGEYRVTVTARRGGESLGSASARFIVYEDDLELSNPAADPTLLRRIAETTGGQFLPPEQLEDYLKALDTTVFTDYQVQVEHRLWDNWPFLLTFATVLSTEWWLRKRHGWV